MKKTLLMIVFGLVSSTYAADFTIPGMKASNVKTNVAAEDVTMPAAADKHSPRPIEWVAIPGGTFMMGTEDFESAQPVHKVAIKTFYISKTDVTTEQYTECVKKGKCNKPEQGLGQCNFGVPGREHHPVNCVTWEEAKQYAAFKGARLPSESEWEYAAKSGGRDQIYPWGNTVGTTEHAVFNSAVTESVCSKPAGNTAQGLCDMAGNVWQWVEDACGGDAYETYEGAPTDGSAVEQETGYVYGRRARGGSCQTSSAT